MKKVVVLSLGGSLIVPGGINLNFLEKFKKILFKHKNKYKFVVICGGGNTARTYIKGLKNEKSRKKQYFQSLLGIDSTRLNARFLTYFFEKHTNKYLPLDMKQIKNMLRFNSFVFCGALRYAKNETSDSAAAKLARYFDADLINITDVKGLYTKDPKKFKDAKFIPDISHKDFHKMVNGIKFTPGQHFVLDQKAAKIMKQYNITAHILGPELNNLDNLLKHKHFVGTIVS